MPQMKPMNWLMLFFILNLILILINIINYFFINLNLIINKKNTNNKMYKNWKW